MAVNKIICSVNNVDYASIRKAMCAGARTLEEVSAQAGTCNQCPGCQENLPWILASVCGCRKVSLQAVLEAIQGGADTVEKVAAATGAGLDCGRCKALVANIIALGR
ncbi:MAG: (2Fe-2S)-binding protein [Oligosphaeraceae bacterium]|nr:(2Fe-2S)-binding protein [Oligosphaeraceae bacterium]